MGMNADQYREHLQALLPRGAAWPREPGTVLTQVLDGLAQELARVDLRVENLLDEINPRTTYELLSDWERVLGLPDPCVPAGQTTAERRSAVAAKIAATGGQSRAYFIALAAALGYTITITEQVDGLPHKWRVNAALNTFVEFTCNSPCTDPLREWGNETLECAINQRAPAHTTLVFGYT
jgi:uncharacterized protein YmfQ (DUF2313 family)